MSEQQQGGLEIRPQLMLQQQQGRPPFRLCHRHCLPVIGEEANDDGDDDGRAKKKLFSNQTIRPEGELPWHDEIAADCHKNTVDYVECVRHLIEINSVIVDRPIVNREAANYPK
jgi:hypothetical protein